MRYLALILILLTPSMGRADAWIIGASAADALTTEYALRYDGLEEGNPLIREQAVRIAAKVAVTIALVYIHREIQKKDRGVALGFKIAIVAVWGGIAVWNIRQVREHG